MIGSAGEVGGAGTRRVREVPAGRRSRQCRGLRGAPPAVPGARGRREERPAAHIVFPLSAVAAGPGVGSAGQTDLGARALGMGRLHGRGAGAGVPGYATQQGGSVRRAKAKDSGIGADPLATCLTDERPPMWAAAPPCDCLTAEEHLSACVGRVVEHAWHPGGVEQAMVSPDERLVA